MAWEGGARGSSDTHPTCWRGWRGVAQVPYGARRGIGPALARGTRGRGNPEFLDC